MSQIIREHLDTLARRCLAEDTHEGYTDEDLFNATEIFAHTMLDVAFSVHHTTMSQEALEELAEKMGNEIHALIKTHTGKDVRTIADTLVQK